MDVVTGGAGFIGSHLVARLRREGRTVRVVDDLSTGQIERLAMFPEVELINADLTTADLTPMMRGVERIFHLAAVPSITRSVRDPMRTHEVSTTATLRLLIAARDAGIERFVFSSSSSVYGETAASPKHEDMRLDPISPYGVAKAAAEAYVRVFARLFGMNTVSLRYFNVFGPSQDPTSPYSALIPIFVTRALANESLTIYGDGEQTRDFTFVANVVEANLAAASASAPAGGVYNIAGGTARSVCDVVRALEGILGRRIDVVHGPPRSGDIRHSHANIGAARSDLGWSPSVPFEEGLRRTVDWYRGGS